MALPASSLDGDVRTLLANLRFTSRPFRDISVGARYRFYDFDDQSPNLTFPARVRTDTIEPFMGTVEAGSGTSIYLGAQVRDYIAHIFAFTVGYRF